MPRYTYTTLISEGSEKHETVEMSDKAIVYQYITDRGGRRKFSTGE